MQAGLDFLADKGLSEPPHLLANGMLTKVTENFEQEIMSALGSESQHLMQLVRRGKLTDAMEDVPAAIAAASAVFPRFSTELLVEADKIKLAPLHPGGALSTHMAWVTPDTVAATSSEGDESGGEEPVSGVAAISHVLALDLCEVTHLELAAHALQAIEASKGGRARLGLLHNPATANAQLCRPAVAAWTALAASTGDGATPLEPLRRFLALQLISVRAGVKTAPLDLLLPGVAPKVDAGLSGGETDALLAAHRAAAEEIGVAPGAAAVITNGRLVHVAAGSSLDAIDLALLEEFEYKQRSEGATRCGIGLDRPRRVPPDHRSPRVFRVAPALSSPISRCSVPCYAGSSRALRPRLVRAPARGAATSSCTPSLSSPRWPKARRKPPAAKSSCSPVTFRAARPASSCQATDLAQPWS